MDEVFGEENVVCVSYEETVRLGVRPVDRRVLAYVGLPRRVKPFYTTDIEGAPEMYSVKAFSFSGGDKKALCIGGPEEGGEMRFFLDMEEGSVVLVDFHGGETRAEVVNSTLDDFVEFLHRFGLCEKDILGRSPEEIGEYVRGMEEVLKDFDPLAFSCDDSWWSMAIDHVNQSEGS
ncbi:SUKH-4 family immunity protein [Streptomyces sp. enrichment culture]|uniref:SUKH-4 family immunity protein n=1 Tax=Streptomyces sp. enrichment culture TaxID=1795815 RepID=UPI003F568F75